MFYLTANVLPTAPSSEIPSMKIHEIISDKLPHPTILKTSSCSASKIYPNVTLLGGIKSGNFTSLGKTKNMQECIGRSCDLGRGDMAFMLGSYCYSVSCYSDRVCQTIPAQPSKFYPRIAFLKWAPKITEEGKEHVVFKSNLIVSNFVSFWRNKSWRRQTKQTGKSCLLLVSPSPYYFKKSKAPYCDVTDFTRNV